MPKYTLKLINRQQVAEGTLAFFFEKPSGFVFKAGQYVEVSLRDPPETDSEGNSRAFSLASAPSEPPLMIATRMRDTAFKRVLGAAPVGSEVQIEGPFGNLILHKTPGLGFNFDEKAVRKYALDKAKPWTLIK